MRLGADAIGAATGYGEAVDAVGALRDQTTLAQGIATFTAKGLTLGGDAVVAVSTFMQKNVKTISEMKLSNPGSIGEGLLRHDWISSTDFESDRCYLGRNATKVKGLMAML